MMYQKPRKFETTRLVWYSIEHDKIFMSALLDWFFLSLAGAIHWDDYIVLGEF